MKRKSEVEDPKSNSAKKLYNDINCTDLKNMELLKEYKYPPLPFPRNVVTKLINQK